MLGRHNRNELKLVNFNRATTIDYSNRWEFDSFLCTTIKTIFELMYKERDFLL